MNTDPTPRNRLDYLDGLRGLAAFVVIFHHMVMGFCPDFGNGNIHGLGPGGWIPLAPFSLLWAGNFCVCLFFALSGFVLAPSLLKTGSTLAALVIRRLIRLTPPVLVALLFAYAIWSAGLFYNQQAAPLGNSIGWFGTFYTGTPRLMQVLHDTIWLPVKTSRDAYDPPVWTMHWEYMGSFGVFLVYTLFRKRPVLRFLCLLILLAVLAGNYYIDFAGGALLADLKLDERATRLSPKPRVVIVSVLLLLAAMFGLDTWSAGPGTPWWFVDWLPHQLIGYQADQAHQLAAIALLAGLLMSVTAQRVLSWRPAVALGHRSFAIYLLHFPILFSAGAFAFASLREPYGFWAAFGAAGLATILPTLFLAALFTRYVDAPSNTLSHLASKRLDKYVLPLWNRITTAFVGKIWRHVPHGRAS